MNEEMYNAYEEPENTEEVEVCEEPEENSGASIKGIAIGIAAIVAATAFVLHKTKAKREEYLVKRLRKKGYTIYKTEVMDDPEESVSDDEEEEDIK